MVKADGKPSGAKRLYLTRIVLRGIDRQIDNLSRADGIRLRGSQRQIDHLAKTLGHLRQARDFLTKALAAADSGNALDAAYFAYRAGHERMMEMADDAHTGQDLFNAQVKGDLASQKVSDSALRTLWRATRPRHRNDSAASAEIAALKGMTTRQIMRRTLDLGLR